MSRILDLVLAGTPAQFDNDASLATTEFVQRGLGSMSATTAITGATTLTAAHVGRVLQVSSSGPYAVTLPLASAVTDGAVITLVSSASGLITIQRQGSDLIYPDMGTGVQSFTLATGDTAILARVNGVWGLIGGSAAMRNSSGDFGASKASSGYQKLPSGLIIQWGTTAASSSSAGVAHTFATAFPSACVHVNLQVSASNSGYMASIETLSNTGFSFSMYSSTVTRAAGITAYWVAIGY
jgi:hypothetical protein